MERKIVVKAHVTEILVGEEEENLPMTLISKGKRLRYIVQKYILKTKQNPYLEG